MSNDPNLDYFSDGMTEDIITLLSQTPDLKVISRHSSFAYKGQAVKTKQVRDELGVRYLLEGSVRKQENKVRITAQLIDTMTDAHVWAERFDEEGTDVFTLQDRVAEKIIGTLSGLTGKIREAEYKRAWKMDAARLEEYDYFLRGHSVMFGFTPETILKARKIWQEGLQKFPRSGLLRIKIGWTHFFFFFNRWGDKPKLDLERAYELALEGLADQNLPPVGKWNGHWLNAFVQLFRNRDYEAALQEARTTLQIVPNDAYTRAFTSMIPFVAGDPDLALEWAGQALSREPHVPLWYHIHLGQAYHAKGDCKRAVEQYEKVPWIEINKSVSLISCYVSLDRLSEAKAELTKLLKAWPDLTIASIAPLFPFKDQAFFNQFLAAVQEAGLPGEHPQRSRQ